MAFLIFPSVSSKDNEVITEETVIESYFKMPDLRFKIPCIQSPNYSGGRYAHDA